MGRKPKRGIDFYRTFADHTENPKIKLLYKDCGGEGYWIWKCVLDYIYQYDGYFFDLKDTEQLELLSEHCKHGVESLMFHFEIFCKRRLFDTDIFRKHQILTSKRVQENFFYATLDRRKKGAKIAFISELIIHKPAQAVGVVYINLKDFSREQCPMREYSSREKHNTSREESSISREKHVTGESISREKSGTGRGVSRQPRSTTKKGVKIVPGKNVVMSAKTEKMSEKTLDPNQVSVDNLDCSREESNISREQSLDNNYRYSGSNENSKEFSKKERELSRVNGMENGNGQPQSAGAQRASENGVQKKSAALHAEEKTLLERFSELVLSHDIATETNWRSNWDTLMRFITEHRPKFPEPYAAVWNLFAAKHSLSPLSNLNTTRREKFKLAISHPCFDFITILNNISQSKFLRGGGENKFKVSWDYIFKNEENFLKIVENQYT